MDARDARGWGFAYSLGAVDFRGWRKCTADLKKPSAFWGAHSARNWVAAEPPLQFHHLRIVIPTLCDSLDLTFRALTVSGEVRITHPGITQ